MRPTTQLALKALLASVVSLPIGYALSPAHPYFVLTAAYAVVTLSFGAVLKTTLQQTLATVVGSLVGLGCAAAMYGIPDKAGLTVALILASFFLGVYLSPLSAAWPGFWLAVIFALLFNLAGGLEEARRILVDQAIGTFAGCTVGMLATLFVLPVDRTSSLFSQKLTSFLSAVKDQIANCVTSLAGKDAAEEVEAGGCTVGSHFKALTAEVGALKLEAGVLGQGRRQVERQLLLLAALNSYIKQLAGLVIREKTFGTDQNLRTILEETQARSVSNIDALRQLLDGKQHQNVRAIGDLQTRIRNGINMESVLAAPDSADAHSVDGLLTLLFINEAVVELARDLGAYAGPGQSRHVIL